MKVKSKLMWIQHGWQERTEITWYYDIFISKSKENIDVPIISKENRCQKLNYNNVLFPVIGSGIHTTVRSTGSYNIRCLEMFYLLLTLTNVLRFVINGLNFCGKKRIYLKNLANIIGENAAPTEKCRPKRPLLSLYAKSGPDGDRKYRKAISILTSTVYSTIGRQRLGA